MIGHDVNEGEGVKGESRRQTQGIVKVWFGNGLLTLVSRLTRSDLSSSASGYK